jgi:hypothetical protein
MSTIAQNIYEYAARAREGEVGELDELNETQRKEVFRQVGNPKGLSPEGLSHAMESYVSALRHQADVARAFYFGHLQEGVEGLTNLPEDIRTQIDQLIWEAAGGEAIDPTLTESQNLIASAIMHSVEMRMGILE